MDQDQAVRAVTRADLATVAEIFGHYVRNSVATFEESPPTLEWWQRRQDHLETLGLPFLVVEQGDDVVGYAYATPWRDKPAYRHAVEGTIYLAPDATGRGLGRVLLNALVRACIEAGKGQLVAVVAETGDPASRAAHLASGFVEVGRLSRIGYKHGRWIDTVLMQRDLGRSPGPSA